MYRDSASLLLGVEKVCDQRLHVPIENDADKLSSPINDRAAGITPNNVGCANEIERSGEIQIFFGPGPTFRQLERWFVLVLGRTFKKASECSFELDLFSFLFIALQSAECQPQR